MRNVFIEAKYLKKIYGPTIAVNKLDISIYKGEVLALIGGNGAGKSTLIKILSGIVNADEGEICIDGKDINIEKYSPIVARKNGIRVVHQELSLCKNLTVYENFYVEQFQRFDKSDLNWRKKAKVMANEALNNVFPNHGIDVSAGLSSLSIAQQQMVEIARSTSDPSVKMLILDEPTSSLPAEQTIQLQNYIKKNSKEKGIAYIYISHRLKEIMYLADYVYVMQNGLEKYQCAIGSTNENELVSKMGSGTLVKMEENAFVPEINKKVKVKFNNYTSKKIRNVSKEMYGGEILAITGLEGNGQLELLHEIFSATNKNKKDLRIEGKVAFVAGDRKKDGIFPMWSIKDNTIISKVSDSRLFKYFAEKDVNLIANQWNDRLKTKCDSTEELITNLSGGNQQKVLIARALALDADIILLDDPTRGVDIETKLELYEVFREASSRGKLIIWRTSDDAELEYCTRLMVMKSGEIVGDFPKKEFDHESMLKLAFESKEKVENKLLNNIKEPKLYLFSLIAMIILYLVSGFKSNSIFTKFGIELLAIGFAPFIFAALAQTFIIGLGHIDLGIGAFMGLVNVVLATVLDENTFLGLIILLVLILVYSCMGIVIYTIGIPPIIVTLGMSFVWLGIAYVIQEIPGGHVPEWFVRIFNFNNPLLQGILIWLILAIVIAILIYRSKYGTVLRGFGNNDSAMRNSGWSKLKAYWVTYLIAGVFAALGGIAQSSITGASDVNASATYTMLTVAAVIIGGGYFNGGVVTHLGTVFGGISLTMISVILGMFRVSTDYTATIQGLALILILSMRLLRKEKLK